jgi:mannose-6-phosphate isomerase
MAVHRTAKPWGEEILFARTERYAGKLLKIRGGESLSLQYHRVKEETLFLYEGRIRLQVDVDGNLEERLLGPGATWHLPPGTRHRLEAVEDAILFEVSTPELDDVVRIEDRYGRA